MSALLCGQGCLLFTLCSSSIDHLDSATTSDLIRVTLLFDDTLEDDMAGHRILSLPFSAGWWVPGICEGVSPGGILFIDYKRGGDRPFRNHGCGFYLLLKKLGTTDLVGDTESHRRALIFFSSARYS